MQFNVLSCFQEFYIATSLIFVCNFYCNFYQVLCEMQKCN